MDDLAFEILLDEPFEQALDRVVSALKEEGFGVLTRIDVHDAFREKLDVEFRNYCILGACNPNLAHRALSKRPDAGLMLPCNVIVEAVEEGGVLVRIIDPEAMLRAAGFADDPELSAVGSEARERLARVADTLAA